MVGAKSWLTVDFDRLDAFALTGCVCPHWHWIPVAVHFLPFQFSVSITPLLVFYYISMVNFYYFNLFAFNAIEFLYLFSFYKFCVDVNKDRMKIFFYKSLEKGVQTQLNKSLRNVRQLLRIFVKYFYTIVFINR